MRVLRTLACVVAGLAAVALLLGWAINSCQILPALDGCIVLAHGDNFGDDGYDYIRGDIEDADPRLNPHWSTDAAAIVYSVQETRRGSGSPPTSRMYIAASDGSGFHEVASIGGPYVVNHSPRISPDGTHVVYVAYHHEDEESRYFVIETAALDGSGPHRLTTGREQDLAPSWSPDGTSIAFLRSPRLDCPRTTSIFTVRADGSDLRQVVSLPGWAVSAPAWSPEGQLLAYTARESHDGPGGAVGLYIASVDGSNVERLHGVSSRHDGSLPNVSVNPAWSPDGERIAFVFDGFVLLDSGDRDGYGKVYTIRRDGTGLRQVANVGQSSRELTFGSLAWSSDGSRLLFTMQEGYGGPRSYLVNADGSGLERIPGELHAAWSPDGSRIVNLVSDDAESSLYTVAPDGSDMRYLVRHMEAVSGAPAGDDSSASG